MQGGGLWWRRRHRDQLAEHDGDAAAALGRVESGGFSMIFDGFQCFFNDLLVFFVVFCTVFFFFFFFFSTIFDDSRWFSGRPRRSEGATQSPAMCVLRLGTGNALAYVTGFGSYIYIYRHTHIFLK